jgi:hypothetical protein
MIDKNNGRLLEPEIKSMLINHLIEKGIVGVSDTIFSELTVDNASRRVDLAISKGKELWAFEIKSEADTLTRLEGQVNIYSKFFDKVFVVVAKKHVESALSIIPTSVALWEIKESRIVVKQKGRKKLIKNPESFIDMMSVSDLAKVVSKSGLKSPSKRRQDLVRSITKVNSSLLREAAFEAITQRYNLSSKMFFEQVMNRKVTPYDISLLSRFKFQGSQTLPLTDDIEDIICSLNAIGVDGERMLCSDSTYL